MANFEQLGLPTTQPEIDAYARKLQPDDPYSEEDRNAHADLGGNIPEDLSLGAKKALVVYLGAVSASKMQADVRREELHGFYARNNGSLTGPANPSPEEAENLVRDVERVRGEIDHRYSPDPGSDSRARALEMARESRRGRVGLHKVW